MTCHGGPNCSPTGMGVDADRVTELKIRDDDNSYMRYKNWYEEPCFLFLLGFFLKKVEGR